ncbi:60S ribosomal protein L14-A [Fusarium oxysporum f. sp. albedinis]|nr:60S ribosomal protein L14-A [Fusarium oxysporum f. sp. albedinis]
MTSNTNELDSELESFRQKWISDLRTRSEHPETVEAPAGPSRRPHHGPISSLPHKHAPAPADDGDDDYVQSRAFDQDEPVAQAPQDVHHDRKGKKLVSALDHFEEAMHKEDQGNMGDSLKLYRKAYRLDNGVDRRYREKHFPQKTAPRPVSPTATKASAPEAPQPPKSEEVVEAKPLPIGELIASFSGLKIEPAPPPIEGMPQPPCPVADLPDEILIHILRDVAITDVGDFARLSRVCKRLAYLVASEQRIWRRVALGPEVGFSSQIYRFEKGVEWDELPEEEQEGPEIQDGFSLLCPLYTQPGSSFSAHDHEFVSMAAISPQSTMFVLDKPQLISLRGAVPFISLHTIDTSVSSVMVHSSAFSALPNPQMSCTT